MEKELPVQLADYHGLRVWVSILNKYDSVNGGNEKDIALQTHTKLLTNEWGIPSLIRNIQLEIVSKNSEVLRNGSDPTYIRTEKITIKVAKWDMGAGRKWKMLPTFLENKRCFANIKNEDEKCFAFAITAYLLQREAVILKRNKWQNAVAAGARGEPHAEAESLTTEEMATETDDFEIPFDPALPNPFIKGTDLPNRPNHYKRHFERFGERFPSSTRMGVVVIHYFYRIKLTSEKLICYIGMSFMH